MSLSLYTLTDRYQRLRQAEDAQREHEAMARRQQENVRFVQLGNQLHDLYVPRDLMIGWSIEPGSKGQPMPNEPHLILYPPADLVDPPLRIEATFRSDGPYKSKWLELRTPWIAPVNVLPHATPDQWEEALARVLVPSVYGRQMQEQERSEQVAEDREQQRQHEAQQSLLSGANALLDQLLAAATAELEQQDAEDGRAIMGERMALRLWRLEWVDGVDTQGQPHHARVWATAPEPGADGFWTTLEREAHVRRRIVTSNAILVTEHTWTHFSQLRVDAPDLLSSRERRIGLSVEGGGPEGPFSSAASVSISTSFPGAALRQYAGWTTSLPERPESETRRYDTRGQSIPEHAEQHGEPF